MTTIAVTGTSYCGKTMFLTSLLWQLLEFEDAKFHLGRQVAIRRFRDVTPRGRTDVFPFVRNQDSIVTHGRWPEKTRDVYRFRCEFERSDASWWARRTQVLEFLDLPGERVADAAIAAYDDYGAWSDHLLEHFDSHGRYREAAGRFRGAAETAAASADDVVGAYRLALATFVLDFQPLVSPSVFLLDVEGRQAAADSGRRTAEEQRRALADARLAGLDGRSQFAPLPRSVREARPDLAKEMAGRYAAYRRTIVVPLFESLMASQSLVVLVDVPMLLHAGVKRYLDDRRIVFDLIEAMGEASAFAGLWRTFGYRSNAIARVAFVATKADLVRPSDLADGRLVSLLRQMNARARNQLPHADVRWFACSACVSTRPGTEKDTLIGVPWDGDPRGSEWEFRVPPLPEAWPGDWNSADYGFPRVCPRTSPNVQIPPRHHQLDAVFDFVAMGGWT